jgi:hypothetical protein
MHDECQSLLHLASLSQQDLVMCLIDGNQLITRPLSDSHLSYLVIIAFSIHFGATLGQQLIQCPPLRS